MFSVGCCKNNKLLLLHMPHVEKGSQYGTECSQIQSRPMSTSIQTCAAVVFICLQVEKGAQCRAVSNL